MRSTGASVGGVQRASCRSAAQERRSAESMSRPEASMLAAATASILLGWDLRRSRRLRTRPAPASGRSVPLTRVSTRAASASAWRCPASAACWRAMSAWLRAKPPAPSATTSRTAAPASKPSQSSVRPPLLLDLALCRVSACLEERSLGRVQFDLVLARPVQRGRQPSAAVEIGRLAAALLPVACRTDEVEAHLATLGVLLEPCLEPRPLAEQGLVGDLDVAIASGQQAGVGERLEHPARDRIAVRVELGRAGPGAGRPLRPRPARPGAGASSARSRAWPGSSSAYAASARRAMAPCSPPPAR